MVSQDFHWRMTGAKTVHSLCNRPSHKHLCVSRKNKTAVNVHTSVLVSLYISRSLYGVLCQCGTCVSLYVFHHLAVFSFLFFGWGVHPELLSNTHVTIAHSTCV